MFEELCSEFVIHLDSDAHETLLLPLPTGLSAWQLGQCAVLTLTDMEVSSRVPYWIGRKAKPVPQVHSLKATFETCVRLVEICLQEFYWGKCQDQLLRRSRKIREEDWVEEVRIHTVPRKAWLVPQGTRSWDGLAELFWTVKEAGALVPSQ